MSTLRALPAYSLDTLWSTVGVVFVYCLRTVCGHFCCCASTALAALEATGGVAKPCRWKPRVPQHTQVRHSLGQGRARAADLTRQPGTEGGAGRGGGGGFEGPPRAIPRARRKQRQRTLHSGSESHGHAIDLPRTRVSRKAMLGGPCQKGLGQELCIP